ncbi:MAG: hypothetical protein JWN82_223 [Candidatus Saccharibacteria bacterium]|nr:hypothetical protein [Candidatus Saccharibacteria bacterium]
MKSAEAAPAMVDDVFSLEGSFDINAAFQEAMKGVISDEEIALEEKVRRMEVIVAEGSSETYRNFVDFRAMATQMEMACMHDHNLHDATDASESLSGFRDLHSSEDGHGHGKHDEENDKKKGKKKKKKRGWFYILLDD